MNSAIRWRIITLQTVLVLVLAGAGGFALYEGNFVRSMITTELSNQQITFPTADALAKDKEAAQYGSDFSQYAGQALTTGDQAKAYANDYIGVHLEATANGDTYASIGPKISALNAQLATMSKTDPGYATLQAQITKMNGQRDTLFKGEMLRGSLLNAYGWWTVGTYSLWAGVGLLIAALAVLGALVYELFFAARQPERIKVAQKASAVA